MTLADQELLEELGAENLQLRTLLAHAYSGYKLYHDDGELQDNSEFPSIDFKRDSASDIHAKIQERGLKKLMRMTEHVKKG